MRAFIHLPGRNARKMGAHKATPNAAQVVDFVELRVREITVLALPRWVSCQIASRHRLCGLWPLGYRNHGST